MLNVLAYSGYVWLVAHAGSVFASQIAYLVTGFGVVWSMLLLGERYSAAGLGRLRADARGDRPGAAAGRVRALRKRHLRRTAACAMVAAGPDAAPRAQAREADR